MAGDVDRRPADDERGAARPLVVGSIAILAAVLIAIAAAFATNGLSTGSAPAGRATGGVASGNGGNAGNAGMMGGMSAGQGGRGVVTSVQVSALAIRAREQANVVPAANRISYHTANVLLVMVGAPPGRPGMFWQVDGALVNPTVVVPAGSRISVQFVNGDPGQHHGFELTTGTPPFPRMAMRDGTVAAPGALIMPLPPPDGSRWYAAHASFTAPPPGTYHYICPVPGHAERGMWGTLVVT